MYWQFSKQPLASRTKEEIRHSLEIQTRMKNMFCFTLMVPYKQRYVIGSVKFGIAFPNTTLESSFKESKLYLRRL